jgi:electron transport complex protein RnfB
MCNEEKQKLTRRELLTGGAWYAGLIGLGGALGWTAGEAKAATVWQIDPDKCIQCGKCATECVLTPSASKCVHAHAMCGYCKLCTGFFVPDPNELTAGAENQQCPTGAIERSFVEDPYYEYVIDEELCIGCGICVKGCTAFGNGSLFLQIRHNRCLNCNECAIARSCPAQAISRVPESRPYLLKNREQSK